MAKRSLTRRQIMKGAGAGAAASFAGSVAAFLSSCKKAVDDEASSQNTPAVIDESNYIDLMKFESRDPDINLLHTYHLPKGSVLHVSTPKQAAVLCRNDDSLVLSHAGIFSFSSGKYHTVIDKPTTSKEKGAYSIYDVRCSDHLIVWSEVDYDTNAWELYCATLGDDLKASNTINLDSGDSSYLPADFETYGNHVYWQRCPNPSKDKKTEHSFLFRWTLGDNNGVKLIESPGIFATAPTISKDRITVTPRVNQEQGVYYGISVLNADTGELVTSMTMPKTVKPYAAVYADGRFGICIEASYNFGGLLGHLGTYLGHAQEKFYACMREPYTAPLVVSGRIVLKNRGSFLVFDRTDNTFFRLPATNNSLDWGDFNAQVGDADHLIVYATTKNPKTGEPSEVTVRVFEIPAH